MPDQNRNPPGFISPEPEAEAAQARRQARSVFERFMEHETEPQVLPELPTTAGVGEFGQTIFQTAGVPEHVGLAAATVSEIDQVARQVFVSVRDDEEGGDKVHLVDFSTPFAGISLEGSEDISDVEQFQVMELEARSAQLTEARLIEGEVEPEISELEFAGTPEIAASVVQMKHEIEERDEAIASSMTEFGVGGTDVVRVTSNQLQVTDGNVSDVLATGVPFGNISVQAKPSVFGGIDGATQVISASDVPFGDVSIHVEKSDSFGGVEGVASVASTTGVSFGDISVQVERSGVLIGNGAEQSPQYTAADLGALEHSVVRFGVLLDDSVKQSIQHTAVGLGTLEHFVGRSGVSIDTRVEQPPRYTAIDFGILASFVQGSGVAFPQTEALSFVSSALDVSSQLFEIPSAFISPREPEAEPGDVLSRVRQASQLTPDIDATPVSYNFSRGALSFTVR